MVEQEPREIFFTNLLANDFALDRATQFGSQLSAFEDLTLRETEGEGKVVVGIVEEKGAKQVVAYAFFNQTEQEANARRESAQDAIAGGVRRTEILLNGRWGRISSGIMDREFSTPLDEKEVLHLAAFEVPQTQIGKITNEEIFKRVAIIGYESDSVTILSSGKSDDMPGMGGMDY